MSDNYSYSRPYGEAAFKIALEDNSLESWSENLELLSDVISDPKMTNILSDPKINDEVSLNFLSSFLNDSKDVNLANFLSLLIKTKRVCYMKEITEIFNSLKFKHNNVRIVEVESAHAIAPDQLESLISLLKEKYKTDVKAELTINKEIIAGIKIKSNNEVIDLTTKNRLDQMRQQLII